MSDYPPQFLKSLTWDRGKEMALHWLVTERAGLDVYFADPHSPWQRGSNENTYWYKMAEPEATSTGVALARAAR